MKMKNKDAVDDSSSSLKKIRTEIFGRLFLCFFLLLFFLFSCQYLSHKLLSEILYLESQNLIRSGNYGLAASKLEEAYHLASRDSVIARTLGETFYRISLLIKEPHQSLIYAQKAAKAFESAEILNPLDAETAYGLAKSLLYMRKIHSHLHPGNPENPYDPIPAFKKALALRPNGITYHYAMAQYYFMIKDQDNLANLIEKIAYNYPPAFDYLISEPFFSLPSLLNSFQNGLERAVKESERNLSANLYLAKTLEMKGDLSEAVSYVSRLFKIPSYHASEEDFFYAGELCLKNKETEKGSYYFISSLEKSDRKDRRLRNIFDIYRDMNYYEPLYNLLLKIRKNFVSLPGIEIYIARSLIDLKRLNVAEQILKELNETKPVAEAFYWLSRIAEKDRNWDAMELAIQKATILDPYKFEYRDLFAQVLRKKKKYVRAEEEATLAIRLGENSSPWMFDTRARIRRDRGDYQGAVADWNSAILLNNKIGYFHADLAEVHLEMGNIKEAADSYRKALDIEPGNDSYRARLVTILNRKSS